MPAFAYEAVDRTGVRRKGRLEAPTATALARSLEERGLVVLTVSDGDAESPRGRTLNGRRRVQVLEVTRALAALLPAGMPLARAIGAAANLASGDVADVLQAIRLRVERGESLASALAAHPDTFSPAYVGLVRAGERSGDLAGAFARLTTQLEREQEIRARLLSALVYPAALAAVGAVAVLVLLLFVLPRFAALLEDAGASLPRSTSALLAASAFTRAYWPAILAGVVAIALGAGAARTTDAGRRALARLALSLPLVGGLRRTLLGARFARLTGVLLGGGAPLLAALDDAVQSIGDPVAQDEVSRVRGRVREGVSLNAAIAEGGLFPPTLAQLVAVGEESGRLHEFLVKAADIFEERTARTTTRLVALAEPAMMVVFGGAVGFVALSLLQAVYAVNAGAFR
jgi:general secretion pathway protein F